MRKLKDKLLDLNEQKAQLDEEKRELIKGKTKLELNIKDSEDAVMEFHSSKVSLVCSHKAVYMQVMLFVCQLLSVIIHYISYFPT